VRAAGRHGGCSRSLAAALVGYLRQRDAIESSVFWTNLRVEAALIAAAVVGGLGVIVLATAVR